MDIELIVSILLGIFIVLKKCESRGSDGTAVGVLAREQKSPSLTQKNDIVVSAAASAFGRSARTQLDDWVDDPEYGFMSSNKFYSDQFDNGSSDDDW